jgi:1,4-alpha-glucan branching enzyme
MSGQSSLQPGMGAMPHAEGTTFRVWAPHADQVFVTGSFSDLPKWQCARFRRFMGLL